MKRVLGIILVVLFSITVMAGCAGDTKKPAAPAAPAAPAKVVIANLPKAVGGAWFNRMKVGVEKYAQEAKVDSFQTGPSKGDSALQAQSLEDLISQKVSAITVVPVAPEALEPILKKAMAAGIVVISHEAAGIKNVNWDVEAFDNAEYGKRFMDRMGALTKGEGEYAVTVGSLTAKSHMEWADGLVARQKEKFPNMKLVTAQYVESGYNQQTSYQRTMELIKKYPNLKGVFCASATDLPGAALAIEEASKVNQIVLVGNGLVSANKDYIKSGAIKAMSFWDPADAGYVMSKVAHTLVQKKEIKDGDNLGVKGYEKIKIVGNIIRGEAWIDVTKENVDQFTF
jgi:simple sugar transport system substrate-binding protein